MLWDIYLMHGKRLVKVNYFPFGVTEILQVIRTIPEDVFPLVTPAGSELPKRLRKMLVL